MYASHREHAIMHGMRKRWQLILLAVIVILINAACDQVTKAYAKNNFKGRGIIRVVDNFVVLKYAENEGAFLSIGSAIPQPFKKIILTFIPVLVLIGMFLYICLSRRLTLFQIICLASTIGGGASNIYDRFVYQGRVIDFLNFGIGSLRTGILNIADLSIFFGAILLILSQLIPGQKEPPPQIEL
jgi:signal peptidase II